MWLPDRPAEMETEETIQFFSALLAFPLNLLSLTIQVAALTLLAAEMGIREILHFISVWLADLLNLLQLGT